MIKLDAQTKKQIEKYKRKVYTQYPGAFLQPVGNGYFTIAQELPDLTCKDVLSEFCIAPVTDPLKAWEYAQMSAKTNQNLNRTHPLRIEGMNMEDKIARVDARRIKSETKLHSRKNKDLDIY